MVALFSHIEGKKFLKWPMANGELSTKWLGRKKRSRFDPLCSFKDEMLEEERMTSHPFHIEADSK